MTLAEAIEAICARWKTQWEAAYPAVPYSFPNEAVTPPADGSAYVALAINEETSRQASLAPIGDRRFERNGRVLIRIGVPADGGQKLLAQYVKTARDVFEGVSFGGVNTFAVSSRPSGTDGRWFYSVVDAPFRYYETK